MVSDSDSHVPSADNTGPLHDGSLLAAIDLGSNSFHLIVARVEHGEIRPVEALAEKVQLGAGLQDHLLSQDAIDRGLECLARFGQLLGSVAPERIRIVATHTLRVARNRRDFTRPARELLGTPVDVIYGREEARLVYLGVAHTLADDVKSRLVIDIGGGSTELIVGERFEPRELESLQMGCVSYSQEFFDGENISPERYRAACNRARLELSHIRQRYHSGHWVECVGSSGTLQAIEGILQAYGWSSGGIDNEGLAKLEQKLLRFKRFSSIKLSGLSPQRRNVILAGVAITRALFDVLGIRQMRTSKGALREGVIYDLLGRLSHEDVRERSINALMQRYNVDTAAAAIVEKRARMLFDATRKTWELKKADWDLLHRASCTLDVGMAISHKHYNRHSAYLLQNTDLAGFSQEEQEQLALLVRSHRGKLDPSLWAELSESEVPRLLRLIALLRLAYLFKHVEQLEQLPEFNLRAGKRSLKLSCPEGWLEQHPLTAWELEQECATLGKLELKLSVQ
ncbi:Ppx/GppA phosphatase family protein [Parahaliea aestuarii]|uniref:Ppx/GppA family phosphatase n=1 Tax=Parahaliea aestuarii TaxID=1852021 RepID=A0A5C8ZSX0_9GAMM|nr:Ppx/GppA phosphatase family protein [Parahaliea aestuarii]TXS91515.1 Ppx/GppA family phosphatase [Parahaliea aestuarii]